ncbi:hypothetical protein [Cellulomonas sp. GbtcB1]|uniref:hypothetical protein n=1 Tax=Cellulomonas sp. GbtcB1 TaxID=2824746 RepID=UPI001C309FEC|nr:hypothetical protein [Cellulomonas sp. GbtcB1]
MPMHPERPAPSGSSTAPATGVASPSVGAAYGDLRRAVRAHRRSVDDAVAAARLLRVADERRRAAERDVERARAALVWSLAVAPDPDH